MSSGLYDSVINYWRGRLEAVCPFYNVKYLEDDAYAKWETIKKSTWPSFVSQRALYADYCEWFSAVILAPINVSEYKEHELPSPRHSRDFNAQIRPYLNLSWENMTCNKRVTVPRNYQGTWFNEQKWQRFYRLKSWKDHVDMFTRSTGVVIDTNADKNHLTKASNSGTVSQLGHS